MWFWFDQWDNITKETTPKHGDLKGSLFYFSSVSQQFGLVSAGWFSSTFSGMGCADAFIWWLDLQADLPTSSQLMSLVSILCGLFILQRLHREFPHMVPWPSRTMKVEAAKSLEARAQKLNNVILTCFTFQSMSQSHSRFKMWVTRHIAKRHV